MGIVMRAFLLMFFLPSALCNAGAWVAESELNSHPKTVFYGPTSAKCEKVKAQKCWNIDGNEPDTSSLQVVREGDWETAVSVEDCSDEADCLSKIGAKSCLDETYSKFHGDLDGDDDLEMWCTRRALVERLKPDQTMIDAKNQKMADEQARRDKLSQAKTAIVQCAKMDTSSTTTREIADCVKAVAKKLAEDALSLSEL